MIYFVSDGSYIKIGYTQDLSKRKHSLATGNSSKLTVLATEIGGLNREKELHIKFTKYKHNREWFEPSGELLEYINTISVLYVDIVDGNVIGYKKMSM